MEFHVVIHEEWKYDPTKGDKCCIRFGIPQLGNWTWDCVSMEPAELDEKNRCVSYSSDLTLTVPFQEFWNNEAFAIDRTLYYTDG